MNQTSTVLPSLGRSGLLGFHFFFILAYLPLISWKEKIMSILNSYALAGSCAHRELEELF